MSALREKMFNDLRGDEAESEAGAATREGGDQE